MKISILILILLCIFIIRFHKPTQLTPLNSVKTGIIASIPETYPKYSSFNFLIQPDHSLLFIRWYYPPPVTLRTGDTWQFHIVAHPTTKSWLLVQHINAQGYIKMDLKNQIINYTINNNYYYFISHIREKIYRQLKITLNHKTGLGFISALTIGMRDQITETQWQDLRGTGTNHLMAIAGLHIGFLGGFIFYVTNFLWRRSEKLLLFKPAQEISLITSFIGAVIYSALSGFAIPAQRALIMLSIFILAQLSRRLISLWTSYLLAFSVILAYEPLSVLTSTLWLSFTAVGLLIYSNMGKINCFHQTSLWTHGLQAQWVMSLGLIPLNLFFFQQLSLISILANIISIPVIGFIILPLSLLGILYHPMWLLANDILMTFWPLMHKLASYSHTQYYHAMSNPLLLIPGFMGILLLLSPKGIPGRWLGIIFLAIVCLR